MDYKYIEQLLDAYWECNTSVEEERILRTFFAQTDVPSHLAKYKPLFDEVGADAALSLDADFDERVMQSIGSESVAVRAKRVSLMHRLRPLYKAAAVVAIVLTLGNAAQHSFTQSRVPVAGEEFVEYKDTYTDSKTAFEQASKAIQMLSKGAQDKAAADSANLLLEQKRAVEDAVE